MERPISVLLNPGWTITEHRPTGETMTKNKHKQIRTELTLEILKIKYTPLVFESQLRTLLIMKQCLILLMFDINL